MTVPVLEVFDVTKTYFQYSSELARVLSWFGLAAQPSAQNCILQGISFSIEAGEAVGIVGQNGAGKSTLLKIITGTQRPTSGRIQVNGHVGAILELGMGFNPDFTGRDNAYHSAGLMGFSQAEIEAIMPEIERFAEIGEYFYEPVHTYSSGMQMRVAFSVVTAFRPALLIVDEALSVGDTYFQHKSFSRIREFQEQGTALLIVSHDRNAILSLCNRAILIEHGKVLKDSDPEAVMDYYNALTAEKENSKVRTKQLESGKTQTLSGTGEATVNDITLLNAKGDRVEVINVGQWVCLRVLVKAWTDLPGLIVGYAIKDRLGQTIFGTNTHLLKKPLLNIISGQEIQLDFSFSANLGPGTYSIAIALQSKDLTAGKNYEWRDLSLVFDIINMNKDEFVGVGWLPPKMECHR
ncbi:MAG: sugar ABC transporter ATP-binding protein [Phormidesmis priestleyi]|uniref:Sugar ABC transporter ATP-binding protein n=1 Tax=Phormidesmis priestleyi TaxID=268141 RepID=A0A2W4XV18_9CYAN|nr:MAG: sugar ABC transporter ATP-binding protein [Phormidesmis priestleyi]